MSLRKDTGLPKLLQCFQPIRYHVHGLLKNSALKLPYQGGLCLTRSKIEGMRISFDPIADTGFWIPPDPDLRSAVEQALEPFEDLRDERDFYREELAKQDCQTIKHAYFASKEYCGVLMNLIYYSLLRMEDASGDFTYQEIWYHPPSYICLEFRLIFSSPGRPHITIISVQPQRASSQEELLCTEFWTLYLWAQKLAGRGLNTTQRCLPMRLVSICGYEARIVSAVLSFAYPRCYEGKEVACQVHIGEYRDLSSMDNIRDLIVELAATPCGNENVQEDVQAEDVDPEDVDAEAEDAQAEDVVPEDVEPEDGQAEDVQAEDGQAEDGQAEDVVPEDVVPEDGQAEDVQAEDVQPKDVQPKSPAKLP